MVPADVRLLTAKDLFLNQRRLTGEAMPEEKCARPRPPQIESPLRPAQHLLHGVQRRERRGHGRGRAYRRADLLRRRSRRASAGERQLTSFDQGVNRFTWLMIRFIASHGAAGVPHQRPDQGDWLEAFLFAVAVAVGLTPEMLPMIVTVNLAKGALAMSRKKVIVKRLNAIQNFGAMDVLCTDKTGTLTQDRSSWSSTSTCAASEYDEVLDYGYLNSYYQSGLKNLLDVAVLDARGAARAPEGQREVPKIDEIPFDFVRRRMSVVVETHGMSTCSSARARSRRCFGLCLQCDVEGTITALTPEH